MFRVTSRHSLASLGPDSPSAVSGDDDDGSAAAERAARAEGALAGSHALECFHIPADYDYSKSTQWNYSTRHALAAAAAAAVERRDGPGSEAEAKADPEFDVDDAMSQSSSGSSGQPGDDPGTCCSCSSPNHHLFDNIRETRDRAWHGDYSPQRTAWQDAFVDSILGRDFATTAVPHERPWAILTCGAYGAGKGFVRRWMEEQGIIPLRDIVHIDPDYFKTQMPEWPGYIRECPEMAGSLTHRESGYIQEIVTEFAMGAHQHVWVDGSLRNVDWFVTFLQNIRTRLPAYRIAIVRVFADEATIMARAEQRGRVTGRVIPVSVLRDSIKAVNPESVRRLYPYTDIVAHVDNSQSPALADVVFGERLLLEQQLRWRQSDETAAATQTEELATAAAAAGAAAQPQHKSWAALRAAFLEGLDGGEGVVSFEEGGGHPGVDHSAASGVGDGPGAAGVAPPCGCGGEDAGDRGEGGGRGRHGLVGVPADESSSSTRPEAQRRQQPAAVAVDEAGRRQRQQTLSPRRPPHVLSQAGTASGEPAAAHHGAASNQL